MTTFITSYDTSGPGVRLAVKDLIDMQGEPTTAGCRAVAARAVPAESDAECLAGAREARARIVGRTNLHELALGVTGVNPWYGTPVNPLDPTLVPGGSSSGSAVAVATGEADVAYGSDTGGSVRIPSACCGTAGLKTTWGRIPLGGVWPLSPSFDTVGPMARDVAGLVTGMQLLEPGFAVADPSGGDLVVARLAIDADPAITYATWWCRGGTRPPCRPASFSWSRHGSPTRRWSRRTPAASATTCAADFSSARASTTARSAPRGWSSASGRQPWNGSSRRSTSS
jgi:amidase